MKKLAGIACVILVLGACKSAAEESDPPPPSGVLDDRALIDLDTSEVAELCDDLHTEPTTITCDGFDVDIPGSDDQVCIDSVMAYPDTCDATVGDLVDCVDALAVLDPCEPVVDIPIVCAPFLDPACQPAVPV